MKQSEYNYILNTFKHKIRNINISKFLETSNIVDLPIDLFCNKTEISEVLNSNFKNRFISDLNHIIFPPININKFKSVIKKYIKNNINLINFDHTVYMDVVKSNTILPLSEQNKSEFNKFFDYPIIDNIPTILLPLYPSIIALITYRDKHPNILDDLKEYIDNGVNLYETKLTNPCNLGFRTRYYNSIK